MSQRLGMRCGRQVGMTRGIHAVLQAARQQDRHWLPRVLQLSSCDGGSVLRRVKTDDEYNEIRAKYGDTTSVEAQLAALRSLGLQAEFRKDGNAEMVELEIENGRPVLVGYYSAGNMLLGEPPMCSGLGCGHWAVIQWLLTKEVAMTLFGKASRPSWLSDEMEKGGWSNPHLGRNVKVRQAAFYQPRWETEGDSTGWVILVSE